MDSLDALAFALMDILSGDGNDDGLLDLWTDAADEYSPDQIADYFSDLGFDVNEVMYYL